MLSRLTISWQYLCAGAALAVTSAAAEVVVEDAVSSAVAVGRARVNLELRLAEGFSAEGALSPAQARAQRESIETTQRMILAELPAADFRLMRRPATVPFLTLEIGPSALEKLREMPQLLVRVLADDTVALQE